MSRSPIAPAPVIMAAAVFLALLAGAHDSRADTARDGAPRIEARLTPAYTSAHFMMASDSRDWATFIHGNPFAGAPEHLGEDELRIRVLSAMHPQNWVGRRPRKRIAHFVPPGGAETREPYAVHVFFDTADLDMLEKRCAGARSDAPVPHAPGHAVTAGLVFCFADTALSVAGGETGPAGGPYDPAVARLLGDLAQALFPESRLLEKPKIGPFNIR